MSAQLLDVVQRSPLTKYMMKACIVSTRVVRRKLAFPRAHSVPTFMWSTRYCLLNPYSGFARASSRLTAAANQAAKISA